MTLTHPLTHPFRTCALTEPPDAPQHPHETPHGTLTTLTRLTLTRTCPPLGGPFVRVPRSNPATDLVGSTSDDGEGDR